MNTKKDVLRSAWPAVHGERLSILIFCCCQRALVSELWARNQLSSKQSANPGQWALSSWH